LESPQEPLPRLGQIAYINILPVTLPLARGLVKVAAQVEYGTPSELNGAYARGDLDLGAMSTFFFLKQPDLDLIPRLSISGDGPVGSVLFFAKTDPRKTKSFRIGATTASATSVTLLQILFKEEYGYFPELIPSMRPDLHDEQLDGALVIGDYALAVDLIWTRRYERRDLGAWWKERLDLPMVFGVWAARSSWASQNPKSFSSISEALVTALRVGLGSAFSDVIEEAGQRTGLGPARLEHYYRDELNFEFTQRHEQSLSKYRELCEKYGLLTRQTVGA
jgi:chorismate dehydratase